MTQEFLTAEQHLDSAKTKTERVIARLLAATAPPAPAPTPTARPQPAPSARARP